MDATPPPPDPQRPFRTQWMNVLAYHLLITVVNLLNLPLERGTFVPRRSQRLTVYTKHVDHLRLLKEELDASNPDAVRAYLAAVKALVFEVRFLVEQEPDLQPNPDFLPDLARLENLLYNAQEVEDFREIAELAYRLSILLPFYEDPEMLEERRAQAEEYRRTSPKRRQG